MAASKAAQKAIQEALSAFSGTAAEKQGLESFISSLKHSDLPTGWQDNPAIVDAAAKMYQQGWTESPFFKAWGGSPEKMYHGTTKDFSSFDSAKYGENFTGDYGIGHYLSQDPKSASRYAMSPNGEGSAVYPLYHSLENPATFKRSFADGDMWKYVPDAYDKESLTRGIRGKGHDGVYINDGISGNKFAHELVVFDPTQIKSIFNRGTFDPSDPNILRGIGIGAAGLGALTAPNLATASTMQKVNKLGQFDQFAKDMPATNDIPTAMRMAQQYSQRSGIDPDAAYKVLQALGRITPEKGLEEPVWSPIDLAAAPVGAVGALGKGAAMALDAPVTYAMDAGIEGLMKLLRGKNESSLY